MHPSRQRIQQTNEKLKLRVYTDQERRSVTQMPVST
jgi:hypothetical protein